MAKTPGKNLSIRSLPADLERAIDEEVKRQNTTKSDVVVRALNEAFHLGGEKPRVRRDVRKFFGKMTAREFREFERLTKDFSTIDEGMWK